MSGTGLKMPSTVRRVDREAIGFNGLKLKIKFSETWDFKLFHLIPRMEEGLDGEDDTQFHLPYEVLHACPELLP